MNEKLKILMLEDSTDDAELVQRLLLKEKSGLEFNIAMSKQAFLDGLDHYKPDLILADNSMPQFSAADALFIVRERNLLTPFILITGTVSEEFAATIIKRGADDYFLKDRLTRLPAAIDSALKQRKLEQQRIDDQVNLKTAHERLLFHVENAPLGFIEWDNTYKVKSLSKRAAQIFGCDECDILGQDSSGVLRVHEEDQQWVNKITAKLLSGEVTSNNLENRNYRKDGTVIWCEWFNSVLTDGNGKVLAIMSLVQDITDRKLAADAIQKSEQKYRTLVEQAFDGILIYSQAGNIIDFNDSIIQYTGYSKKEFQALNMTDLFFEDDLKEHRVSTEKLLSGAPVINNRRLKRKNGSFIEMEIATKMLPDGNFMVIARDLTERSEAARALHEMEQAILDQKVQEQKKITRAIINAQEKERNFIGQELHDNINQILAGAKLYLTVASKRHPELISEIDYPKELIDSAMNEIRLLSSHYVSPLKNADLEEMVQELLEPIDQNTVMKTVMHYSLNGEINDDLKLNIYRIIQEQLNNIIKHANAKRIDVVIESSSNEIRVIIKDDGIGFDVSRKRNGVGILNMMNRIESFNGDLKINSSPGNGCKIEIDIPITDKQ